MKGSAVYMQKLKQRCTSLHSWELPKQTGALAPDYVWTNRDMGMICIRPRLALLAVVIKRNGKNAKQTNGWRFGTQLKDPTPVEDRTWSIWTIMAYWATDTINLSTWQTASAILEVGLSWREAIPIMLVGNFCVAVPLVLNGSIGAKLHVPFPVIASSSFGYYLRYFCIVSRAILAMFWLGIQVSVLLKKNSRFYEEHVEKNLTTAWNAAMGFCRAPTELCASPSCCGPGRRHTTTSRTGCQHRRGSRRRA